MCQSARLDHFAGLVVDEPERFFKVDLRPYSCCFSCLDWVGFADFDVDENGTLRINDESAMWRIPEFKRMAPLSLGHIFSGSFCGWGKAWEWMEARGLVQLGSTFYVDSDPSMIHVWEHQNQAEIFHFKVPFDCDLERAGVCCAVDDSTWLNLCRAPDNLIWTISPPCTSWSTGGSETGLQSNAGMSFLQVVKKIRQARPVCVGFECTEKTPTHPHQRLLQFALRQAGYRQAWTTVCDIAQMNKDDSQEVAQCLGPV